MQDRRAYTAKLVMRITRKKREVLGIQCSWKETRSGNTERK